MSNNDLYQEVLGYYQEIKTNQGAMNRWFTAHGHLIYGNVSISSRIQTSGNRACWVRVIFHNPLLEGSVVEFKADDYIQNTNTFHLAFVKMLEHMDIPDYHAPHANSAFHERIMNESIKIVMRNYFLLYKNRISGEPEWVDEMIKNLETLIVERVSKT